MLTLTIRDIDEAVERTLRDRAAEHGVSVEEEARAVLSEAIAHVGSALAPVSPIESKGEWQLGASFEELRALGRKPDKPFDLKKLSDEMWDESL